MFCITQTQLNTFRKDALWRYRSSHTKTKKKSVLKEPRFNEPEEIWINTNIDHDTYYKNFVQQSGWLNGFKSRQSFNRPAHAYNTLISEMKNKTRSQMRSTMQPNFIKTTDFNNYKIVNNPKDKDTEEPRLIIKKNLV